jgi:hypothetical protein
MRITRTKNKVPIRRIAKVVVIAIFKQGAEQFAKKGAPSSLLEFKRVS